MNLKQNIDKLLKLRNMNADELIRLSGISKSTYYHQFNSDAVKVSFLQKIAEVLKVPIGDLISENLDHPITDIQRIEKKMDLLLQQQEQVIKLLQKKNEFNIETA